MFDCPVAEKIAHRGQVCYFILSIRDNIFLSDSRQVLQAVAFHQFPIAGEKFKPSNLQPDSVSNGDSPFIVFPLFLLLVWRKFILLLDE